VARLPRLTEEQAERLKELGEGWWCALGGVVRTAWKGFDDIGRAFTPTLEAAARAARRLGLSLGAGIASSRPFRPSASYGLFQVCRTPTTDFARAALEVVRARQRLVYAQAAAVGHRNSSFHAPFPRAHADAGGEWAGYG
jgi:hypothetical protein